MSKHDYARVTAWLKEAFDSMTEIEDKFMYHSNDLEEAENLVVEATQLYFEVAEVLEGNKDYEHYQEFDDKFTKSYAFITSNYLKDLYKGLLEVGIE